MRGRRHCCCRRQGTGLCSGLDQSRAGDRLCSGYRSITGADAVLKGMSDRGRG